MRTSNGPAESRADQARLRVTELSHPMPGGSEQTFPSKVQDARSTRGPPCIKLPSPTVTWEIINPRAQTGLAQGMNICSGLLMDHRLNQNSQVTESMTDFEEK